MSNLRMCFGHQSVGEDLLRAIESAGSAQILADGQQTSQTVHEIAIRHRRVGRNGDPSSKIDDFVGWCESQAASWANIALLKLCYVDVDRNTDAQRLVNEITMALTSLRARFPATRFAVATVPLTRNPTLIDRLVVGVRRRCSHPALLDNMQRNVVNDRLRAVASPELPVFDLARLESRGSTDRGASLARGLSRDHGHLNQFAARSIAAAMLEFARQHAEFGAGSEKVVAERHLPSTRCARNA